MVFSGQYLTYNDYRHLGGTLAESPFDILEFECRSRINERTQGRLKSQSDIPQEVKMCMFSLMECIESYVNKSQNKNVASENIDGYSVTYISGGQIRELMSSKSAEIDDIIRTYLTGVIVNNEHILFLGAK